MAGAEWPEGLCARRRPDARAGARHGGRRPAGAAREFGTKSFAEIIAPAIERAEATPLDELRAGTIRQGRRFFELWPTSKAVFIESAGTLRPGALLRQRDLARTMRAMADAEKNSTGSREARIDAVRDYFYRGDIARKIDAFMRENDGLLRYEDMAAFKLQVEDALSTTYRGVTVHKPGFWSQGPSMIQALNLLEAGGFSSLPVNSVEYIHQLTEALKLIYADRDAYYGDPKFVQVPAERLLSREYAAERWPLIGSRASLDFRPGEIDGRKPKHPSTEEIVRTPIDDALMARDTTSIDAIDKNGIMFSATPSGAWLPSVIAGDTGIPMTQRAQSFLLVPGHPNELAGGKRPRVTLSPTLVTRGGKPLLALSTPGGDNQEQSLLQVLLNVVQFGMNVQQAVEAPRIQTRHLVSSFDNHSMNPGDLILDDRISGTVVAELRERGHKVQLRSRWSSGRRSGGGARNAGRHSGSGFRPIRLSQRPRLVAAATSRPRGPARGADARHHALLHVVGERTGHAVINHAVVGLINRPPSECGAWVRNTSRRWNSRPP